jgi:hypothetical protein
MLTQDDSFRIDSNFKNLQNSRDDAEKNDKSIISMNNN